MPFHLLTEDEDLVLSAISVPFDSNRFYVVSLSYVILSKAAYPAPSPPLQYHHVYSIISFILDVL